MSLLNYTTKIDADKTASEIAKCLSMHGASSVMTEYDLKGFVTALSFTIVFNGQKVSFRLPSDWRPVLEVMNRDSKIPVGFKTNEQAVRVAWRIIKDWVEAQMALVETRMVTTAQVFLPYAVTRDGKTLSEKIGENPALLLGSGE